MENEITVTTTVDGEKTTTNFEAENLLVVTEKKTIISAHNAPQELIAFVAECINATDILCKQAAETLDLDVHFIRTLAKTMCKIILNDGEEPPQNSEKNENKT